ncbi:MAG: SDR family oxidoreductase [Bacteroidetes bacterium]|nr:SDR family oxidoreductase [Bacteroidota bacterium]
MYKTPFHTNDISKNSFLVTGGAGFIGSNIVEYLLKYNAGKVVVLDNLSTGFEDNIKPYTGSLNFKFIKGDICNPDDCSKACEGINYLFHQAALGSVPRSIKNPLATNEVNVNGFLNMLVAARDKGIKRFVYASSSSVYGDSKQTPKIEENIGNALSPYAVSKRTNELYGNVFALNYNMQIIGLRYFNIFGPRQNPKGEYAAAIPLFMDALLKNQSPYINGDGEQSRDFTFVENAVQANIKAMFTSNKDALGQVYNIAVGEKISVNILFNILKELSGANVNAIHREDRVGDVRNSLADISKAKRLIGYEPKIKMQEGLKITLNWFSKYFGYQPISK